MTAFKKMTKLKPFQRMTADEATKLLKSKRGKKRVLVADEVGLGKTMIAKGVIARLIDTGTLNDKKMVIYICSNTDIAVQNIRTLKRGMDEYIAETNTPASTRLTMLYHQLQIPQEDDVSGKTKLFALTPATSFKISDAVGKRSERELIYSIMCHHPEFFDGRDKRLRRLKTVLFLPRKYKGTYKHVTAGWNRKTEKEVKKIQCIHSSRDYAKCYAQAAANWLNEQAKGSNEQDILSFNEILTLLRDNPALGSEECYDKEDRQKNTVRDLAIKIIRSLRIAFANIGVEKLEPGLVIMDEFQRFSDLVHEESNSTLANKLISKLLNEEDASPVPTLLLSATPFKFYSTYAEDQLNPMASYVEFKELMDFLSGGSADFSDKWGEYVSSLEAVANVDDEELEEAKGKCVKARTDIENLLRRYILRTERGSTGELENLVRGGDELSTENSNYALPAKEEILAYQTAAELFKDQQPSSWLAEYSESTPFLLSFMTDYSPKKRLDNNGGASSRRSLLKKATMGVANNKRLWLSYKELNDYRFMPLVQNELHSDLYGTHHHGRFSELFKQVLPTDIPVEQLLWVPPTHQCYLPPKGSPFEKVNDTFSKTIIFSSWRMSPKALSCLFSYECERRNVETLKRFKSAAAQASYFGSKNKMARDQGRLVFKLEDKRKGRDQDTIPNIAVLTYPSVGLASIDIPNRFAPLGTLASLDDVFLDVRKQIVAALPQEFKDTYNKRNTVKQPRYDWYLAAMMLFDDVFSDNTSDKTLKKLKYECQRTRATELDSEDAGESQDNALGNAVECFDRLIAIRTNWEEHVSRDAPADLYDMLALIAIGSPAVCALRSFGEKGQRYAGVEKAFYAFKLAYAFVKRMNNRAHHLALRAALVKTTGKRFSWEKERPAKDLLRYCCAGNFQAMLDEYVYLKKNADELDDSVHQDLIGQEKAKTIPILHRSNANYNVEVYKGRGNPKTRRMRTHFATTFEKGTEEDERSNRRVSVRNAFNSPFWPFVLATTSVGQEGLDFHMYCRRIVHWSVPSNPVDLEQREGRINRYDCMAVRKTLYSRYADRLTEEQAAGKNLCGEDLWSAIGDVAEEEVVASEGKNSGLLPHWGVKLGDDKNTFFPIERVAINYPLSRYALRYEKVLRDRELYRLVLGQPDQEILLRKLQEREVEGVDLSDLFINLCPFARSGN